jgi:hypothetical protein
VVFVALCQPRAVGVPPSRLPKRTARSRAGLSSGGRTGERRKQRGGPGHSCKLTSSPPSPLLGQTAKATLTATSPNNGQQGRTDAVQEISAELKMSVEKMEAGLATLEAQPWVVQEALLLRFAEAWLKG